MAEIFTDTLGSVDQRTHHVNRHVVTTCFRTDFIFMDCRLGNTFYFFLYHLFILFHFLFYVFYLPFIYSILLCFYFRRTTHEVRKEENGPMIYLS